MADFFALYQFDKPVVLNVAQELAHPRAAGPLSALFPGDVRQEAARRYQHIQANVNRCRWVGMAWVAGVIACLMLLAALSLGKGRGSGEPRGMLFWVLVVTILGPLGFLVWLVVGRGREPGAWRVVLMMTLTSFQNNRAML